MYKDLEATLHDVFWDAESSINELSLIEKFLNHTSGNILEAGCGSCRLLAPLAKKGYHIEGLELSEDMISLAVKKAKEQHLTLRIHQGDIRTFQFSTLFDTILIPAFTLQLLTRKDAVTALKNLRNCSHHQSKIYLSVFIPWAEITDDIAPEEWAVDKQATYNKYIAFCHTKHSIQRVQQTLHREHLYELKQHDTVCHQHQSKQTLQWYFLPELQNMLHLSGWELEDWDADFTVNHQDDDASILSLYGRAI